MRIFLAAFSVLMIALSSQPARAFSDEIKIAANSQIMATSRWGMCLLDNTEEKTVKGIMTALGMKLDAKFETKYGVLASNVAREIYGDNFLVVYYNLAKAEHEKLPANHQDVCRRYSEIVLGLTN